MSNSSKRSDPKSVSDEYVNALIDQAADMPEQAMPDALRARIIEDGQAFVRSSSKPQTQSAGFSRWLNWWSRPTLAWSAAVLSLSLTLFLWFDSTQPQSSLDQALAGLSAQPGLPWKDLGEDGYADIRGYVKWDNEQQLGYMEIAGIPVNDQTEQQYQLWIVDPARDKHPVDGGVFDIGPGVNQIAIDPKLEILEPKAFAVTLEKAGGVVVSEGPLLFIASI